MKKARKLIFLLILGIVPLVLKADEMEVVKYRWYTKVESNVHYEKDALDVCEYFDLNDYIESDYIYTLEKPEEKSYRTIEMVPYELNVSRNYVSIIRIEYVNNYAPGRKPVTFNEIEVYDKNNEKIPFTLKSNSSHSERELENLKDNDYETNLSTLGDINIVLENAYNIEEVVVKIHYPNTFPNFTGVNFRTYLHELLFTNAYESSSEEMPVCEEDECTLSLKVSKPYDERINLKTLAYRYKDKYYKCYSEERLYVPGYYEELEGFIKDEEKELVLKTNTVYEEKEEPKEEQKEEVQEEIKEEQEEIKELDSNEEQEVVKTLEKEENDNIIATNYKTSEERNDFNFIYTYIIIFIILALLLSLLIIITKKVKKSRMK